MPVFPRFNVAAIIVRFRTQSVIRERRLARELRYQSYGFNGLTRAHEPQAVTTIRDNENLSRVCVSRAQYYSIATTPRPTYG